MNQFWSEHVHALQPYVPGEQPKISGLIKLNTNENPYGPSPAVQKAIIAASNDGLRLYPDPTATELKEALADYYAVNPNQVFLGNGSDEVLAHIFNALFQHKKPILFPDISYSFYPVYCKLYQIDYQTVALDDNLAIQWQGYQQDNGGIIFPNPNAPTGKLVSLNEIESLLNINQNSVVVVDEAYIDFGGDSAIALVDKYPNLLVTQTFSKSRSLAGMRVGFAIGNEQLIQALTRVKDSFNSYPLGQLAIVSAIAALKDEAYFQAMRQKIIDEREQLTDALQQLGFEVLPSAANFIFARHEKYQATDLADGLRKEKVIVRHFKQKRIEDYLRITIGNSDENSQLLAILENIIALEQY